MSFPILDESVRKSLEGRTKARYERALAQYVEQQTRRILEAELDSEPPEYQLRTEREPALQQGDYNDPVIEAFFSVRSPTGQWIAWSMIVPVEPPTPKWYHETHSLVLSGLHSATILDREQGRDWIERPDTPEPLERDPENPNIARGNSGTCVYNPKHDRWERILEPSDIAHITGKEPDHD